MDNFTFFSTHELKVPPAPNKPDLTNKQLVDEIVVVAERERNSFFSQNNEDTLKNRICTWQTFRTAKLKISTNKRAVIANG